MIVRQSLERWVFSRCSFSISKSQRFSLASDLSLGSVLIKAKLKKKLSEEEGDIQILN